LGVRILALLPEVIPELEKLMHDLFTFLHGFFNVLESFVSLLKSVVPLPYDFIFFSLKSCAFVVEVLAKTTLQIHFGFGCNQGLLQSLVILLCDSKLLSELVVLARRVSSTL
jgi:hypothetical protein